jgi:hypothetical protein
MRIKFILGLALAMCGGLMGCRLEQADKINPPAPPSTGQINPKTAAQAPPTGNWRPWGAQKLSWTDVKVTLYRSTGGQVRLNAKRAVYYEGQYQEMITAFIDPTNGHAWVGDDWGAPDEFFLETESGIIRGEVVFVPTALNAVGHNSPYIRNGTSVSGTVVWIGSAIPRATSWASLRVSIEDDRNDFVRVLPRYTRIALGGEKIGNGINLWAFLGGWVTIKAVEVNDGQLHLDFTSPDGDHQAGIWIDLKTRQVVKTTQDANP